MSQFLNQIFFSNTISNYLIFLSSLVVSIIFVKIIEYVLLKRLHAWAKKAKKSIDSFFVRDTRKYLLPILYFTVIYLNLKILYFNPNITRLIDTAMLAVTTFIGAIFISSISIFAISKYWRSKTTDESNELALRWISGITKVVIWGIALILFLDNIGFKINSLIAGLGIGGLALAFAAQAILGDVFCFFTIFFDRPFETGDFIVAGEQMGTVEHIGMKTTRLRALSGEQLIFSNTDLTSSRIRNYKTMEQRRVLFSLGVTYETSYEKLKEIPDIIKNIVDAVPDTKFGRAHFNAYGTYSLNFEIAYYVLTSDYDRYMDIHQEINLRIKEAFEKNDIAFALPTQTIQMPSSSPFTNSENSIKKP